MDSLISSISSELTSICDGAALLSPLARRVQCSRPRFIISRRSRSSDHCASYWTCGRCTVSSTGFCHTHVKLVGLAFLHCGGLVLDLVVKAPGAVHGAVDGAPSAIAVLVARQPPSQPPSQTHGQPHGHTSYLSREPRV